jgi:DnaJ-class molecular chaperone
MTCHDIIPDEIREYCPACGWIGTNKKLGETYTNELQQTCPTCGGWLIIEKPFEEAPVEEHDWKEPSWELR